MKNQITPNNSIGNTKQNMGLLLKLLLLVLMMGLLAGCSPEEVDSNSPLLGSNEDQVQDPTSSESDSDSELETDSDSETDNSDTAPVENDSESKEDETSSDALTDSGTYMGQADSNSIEIKLSGVPDDNDAYKVFELSEDLKLSFESLSLETNMQVRFTYYQQENGQPLLTSIEEITN